METTQTTHGDKSPWLQDYVWVFVAIEIVFMAARLSLGSQGMRLGLSDLQCMMSGPSVALLKLLMRLMKDTTG